MRLLALFSGLLVGGLLLELSLRVLQPEFARPSVGKHLRYHFLAGNLNYAEFYVPDPVLGWRHAPGARRPFSRAGVHYEYRINSFGMHSAECSQEPEPGVFRILVLGDSQAITQVGLEYSHPQLTEDCLNESRGPDDPTFEVLNLGVAGYGFSQYLNMLLTQGLDHKPALVLLQANPSNDFADEFPQFMDLLWEVADRYALVDGELVPRKAALELELAEPSATHDFLYGNLALYRAYSNYVVNEYYYNRDGFLHSAAAKVGVDISPPGMPLIDFDQLKKFNKAERGSSHRTPAQLACVQAILARMNEATLAAGSRLAIIANPLASTQSDTGFSTDRRLRDMVRRLGVPFLDINKRVADYLEPGENAFEHMTFVPDIPDEHFDVQGNRTLARMICDWLKEGDLLQR